MRRSNLFHVHRDLYDVFAAAGQNSRDRTDIAEITAKGDYDVFFRWLHVVGRIKIHPTNAGAENPEPCVRSIHTHEAWLAFRWTRAQVTAYIARGQAERTQARDAQMREVLADPAPLFPYFFE